jgi:hypothetical protein
MDQEFRHSGLSREFFDPKENFLSEPLTEEQKE